MASSSVERGATRAPPPPDELASLYKLVDKQVIAAAFCRHARDAELSTNAAVQAAALFGDNDSLVVANLRMSKSRALTTLATVASGAERKAYLRRSWDALLSLIPLLLRRLEANTLLPGTVREEELDYTVHLQVAVKTAQKVPLPSPAALRVVASTIGYDTLVTAMYRGVDLLQLQFVPPAQKRSVESFVLRGLDVIPRTAGIQTGIQIEEALVSMIEKDMNPQKYEPTFYAAVLRKWRSNAVSSVLRARGVLQTGIATSQHTKAEFDARQRADVAKHGLRDCALPSCSKTERTVKEFAGCSGCRSVVYCCLEHQALDWRAHKKACREKKAARLAAEAEADEEAGAGPAAA